jgi:hypothetical protein
MAARPFTDVLRDARYGELHEELTNQLNELVKAVGDTNKAGQLTLTIKFKPSSGGAIEMFDEVKLKKPELPKGSSIFFATVENNLVRNNPRQPELTGLREVASDQSKDNLKTVNG